MNFEAYVRECLQRFRRPRQICICDNFIPGEFEIDADYQRCKNCNGWMSGLRAMELRCLTEKN